MQNFESYHPIAKKLVFHPGGFLNTWEFFNLIYQGKYALIGTWFIMDSVLLLLSSYIVILQLLYCLLIFKHDWQQ